MAEHLPILRTLHLRLAVLDARHADAVAEYFTRSREHMRPWNPTTTDEFFTPAWQAERLEYDLIEFQAGRMGRFWVCHAEDEACERIIGHVALSNIIRGALQGCHLGYMIDEGEANKGFTTEAAQAVIAYAFDQLDLHRIEANIMPRNARSIRVAEKLGFTREGFSPKYLRINGVWEDHFRYGLVRGEG